MTQAWRNFFVNMFLVGCFFWFAGFAYRDAVGHNNLIAGIIVAIGAVVAGTVLLILTFTDGPYPEKSQPKHNPFNRRAEVFSGLAILASMAMVWNIKMWPVAVLCCGGMIFILVWNKIRPPIQSPES